MSTVRGIRRLYPGDAVALVALRREALANSPLAFEASPEDDRGLSLDFVRHALSDAGEQAVFGYFQETSLAGMVGVARAAAAKRRHKAYVWGMYVAPRARRRGVGRGLLDAAIAHARGWPEVERLHLSVTAAAAPARRIYEEAGFRAWGEEARALRWEGRFVDEVHLVLELDRPERERRKPGRESHSAGLHDGRGPEQDRRGPAAAARRKRG